MLPPIYSSPTGILEKSNTSFLIFIPMQVPMGVIVLIQEFLQQIQRHWLFQNLEIFPHITFFNTPKTSTKKSRIWQSSSLISFEMWISFHHWRIKIWDFCMLKPKTQDFKNLFCVQLSSWWFRKLEKILNGKNMGSFFLTHNFPSFGCIRNPIHQNFLKPPNFCYQLYTSITAGRVNLFSPKNEKRDWNFFNHFRATLTPCLYWCSG